MVRLVCSGSGWAFSAFPHGQLLAPRRHGSCLLLLSVKVGETLGRRRALRTGQGQGDRLFWTQTSSYLPWTSVLRPGQVRSGLAANYLSNKYGEASKKKEDILRSG